MAEIYHNMTPGHLKCNNSLIWLQNLQKLWKVPKQHFFLQVRGNWKPHFFIFSKALFMARNSQVMTPGHLNCNNSLIWLLNQQNYKKSQNNIFLQVRGHRKLRFFFVLSKALLWQEIIKIWHKDTWNIIKHSFGCKICKIVKSPKTTFFCRSSVIENFIFFIFSKVLFLVGNRHNMRPRQM